MREMMIRGCVFPTGLLVLFSLYCSAQQRVQGWLADEQTEKPLAGVRVFLEGHQQEVYSNSEGIFMLEGALPFGEKFLVFVLEGYKEQRFPVILQAEVQLELGLIMMSPDLLQQHLQSGIITLSEQELDEEDHVFDNVAGMLQATRDAYLNAAAFDFGQTFYRPRGLGSEDGVVLINGIEMNKLYDGRPQWSNWGGLNDVQRNQEFSMGMSPAASSFGGLAGTTNIIMRASHYTQGGKFSYASSNRTYSGRAMGSYHSGLNRKGWAYVFSLSRRFADAGFRDGSLYDANSFFVSVEKKLGNAHSLNFSGIYTPNRRGKTSPNTQEVYDLKGVGYNSYWGLQEGEIRNSREKRIEEPILMLNHYWMPNPGFQLNTNMAYQWGYIGNSRIDYGGSRLWAAPDGEKVFLGGGSNPDPAYYQKLPGYFLRFEEEPNYTGAFTAQEEFVKNGQLDWEALYFANLISTEHGGNSAYVLYEDRNEDSQLSVNSIVRAELNPHMVLNAKLGFRTLRSKNFAKVLDLLGGNSFLDVDSFSDGEEAQNNLLSPDRLVSEGAPFKYHYDLHAQEMEAFLQGQFTYKKIDFYLASEARKSAYQRNGFYLNGNFPDNSFGRSKPLNFYTFGGKAGITFKMTGRHLWIVNASYITKPPKLRNSFSNARQNNELVQNTKPERTMAADMSYVFRHPKVKARLTGYFIQTEDATDISFYYADGLSGIDENTTTAFVQEVLSEIGERRLGGELGVEVQLTPTLGFKAAAGVGDFRFHRNPKLYLTSDDFEEIADYGTAYLRNYRLPGGPHQAVQIGFDYRDPEYWFVSVTGNHFSNAWLDVAPLTRTRNFYSDTDGLPLIDYDPEIARNLLAQEKFDSYFLINMIGGKSWKVRQYYIGVFASINNLLNVEYKTGGFEQSRNANYRSLKQDWDRATPIFAPKYWYGFGTTYYAHVYIRF